MKDDYTDADGWTYTTPIYAGDNASVAKAITCQHEYADQPLSETKTPTHIMVMQKCQHCCAMRAKSKPLHPPEPGVTDRQDET